MDKNKLIIAIAILLAACIVGGFVYAAQVNKQDSIERQQLLKLEEDRRVAESNAEREQAEFISKKKNDCLSIYKTEDDKWNNVSGWRYNEQDDECYVEYKETTPKSEEECDENYPTGGEMGLTLYRLNNLCKNGRFEKLF